MQLDWWVWLVLAFLVFSALWGAISPASQWRVYSGWAYRDREANEPSDAAYLATRLGCIVALIILVVAGVNIAFL